eukprot:scaffold135519_cov81-Cyclotella_meneghiniana.AAC.1
MASAAVDSARAPCGASDGVDIGGLDGPSSLAEALICLITDESKARSLQHDDGSDNPQGAIYCHQTQGWEVDFGENSTSTRVLVENSGHSVGPYHYHGLEAAAAGICRKTLVGEESGWRKWWRAQQAGLAFVTSVTEPPRTP